MDFPFRVERDHNGVASAVATRDLEQGDVVLEEEALCTTPEGGEHTAAFQMVLDLTNTYGAGPSPLDDLAKPDEMVRDAERRGIVELGILTKLAAVDILKFYKIVHANVFGVPALEPTHASLFHDASFFNHSCVPNCNKDFEDGKIVITANKSIHAGEELKINYFLNGLHVTVSGRRFRDAFRVPCNCGNHN